MLSTKDQAQPPEICVFKNFIGLLSSGIQPRGVSSVQGAPQEI